MRKLLLLVLFVSATMASYAGGYRVSVQGQRAVAMGHTGVAVVNSAELVFFNPAGLVYLENKLNVSAGVSGIFTDVIYQSEEFGLASETDSSVGTPLNLYGSYKVNDWMAVGLGVYTPYGSEVTWPTDWPGSHLVNNIDLAAIYVQPVVSFKLSDHFSIGGGPIYVTGSVNFNRNASRTLQDIDGNRSNITVDDSGVTNWGWSVGAMFSPSEKFRLGFNYRSEIIMEVEGGEATFSNFPNSPATPANGTTTFDAELPLPAELTVGLSYKFHDKWLFAFDYNRQYWSVYESLDIRFGNGSTSINPRNYKDSSVYRFGLEYQATNKITLRAGYYRDESPVQSGFFAPETPRNDSDGYTGGFSFAVTPKLSIDASFFYLRFEEVDESYDFSTDAVTGAVTSFGGTYKSSAFAPGLGLTYKL
ncbi:OmpP1/FadL family transporter [Aquimarina sp. 2201CG5-10]|uniref:OmpP1/FadL family transporter n=1 Tax=Aquimarina callyspongiae TaxID=3098150 RepID=UPI002AB4ECF5|nr:outer membrane protein transport protein [Aquimarina sp. 2201CG5-10]MDY8136662.1 outer membrane protein transport protein [Aquimarina sp. 2201CG5-10]